MLLLAFALHASSLAVPRTRQEQQTIVRDSTSADSTTRRGPKRLPVTAAVLATAFRDEGARELFGRAKIARLAQDSAMKSYDAKVRQRISVRAAVGKTGPDRLVYRGETAARVQWQLDVGAHIDVTGTRVAFPILGIPKMARDAVQDVADDHEMLPIPYFPGSETLWIGGNIAKAEVDEDGIVNPLATGAEAYYTYQTGDSLSMRLPNGQLVLLRELAVRPRTPKGNLAVGSLWFDVATAQLVRAVYRLAAPIQNVITAVPTDSAKTSAKIAMFAINSLFAPNVGEVSAIAIEYGLYEGRFWLPRLQSMEGSIHAMFARVPIRFENSFTYASINGSPPLPKIQVDTTAIDGDPKMPKPPIGMDSLPLRRWIDSTRARVRAARMAREDSIKSGKRVGSMRQCDSASTRVITQFRSDGRIPVSISIPCSDSTLVNSRDFDGSIYEDDDAAFGNPNRDQLIATSLSMSAQAPITLGMLPRPRLQFGPSMSRYNRVEGFSTGLLLEQQLGGGYSATVIGRYGFSDRLPKGELSLARTNLNQTIRLNGYRRLESANDWGSPLSFSSSLSALLFGQDDGFYYRASGVEAQWSTERRLRLDWRAFSEMQHSAVQHTTFSIGGNFGPNIIATRGTYSGLSAHWLKSTGDNPRKLRTLTEIRLEAATGDSTYGRGAFNVTLSRALYRLLSTTITVSAGSSVGQLPSQRRWFLGGTSTVRGQRPDTAQSGSAFWLSRLEISSGPTVFRTSVFGDLGWTGSRNDFTRVGQPLSGAGIGFAALDGLLRLDIARGLFPRRQTRISFYLSRRL